MKSLIEISEIVSKNSSLSREMSYISAKESKLSRFINLLVSKQVTSDDEAEILLYPSEQDGISYRNLKSRAKYFLLKRLLDLDIRKLKMTDYGKAYYECQIKWTWIKLLLLFGGRNSAISIAKSIIRLCESYQFHDLGLMVAKTLRDHFANKGNVKHFKKFAALTQSILSVFSYELKAEELYYEVIAEYVKCAGEKEKIKTLAKKNYQQVAKLPCNSHVIEYYQLSLCVIHFSASNKWADVINATNIARNSASNNPLIEARLPYFALSRMEAYRILKDFNNAKKDAKDLLKLFRKGSNNWFIFLEEYFYLTMHTENYDEAHRILQHVKNSNWLSDISTGRVEKWRLFEAYLLFMTDIDETVKDKRFKLGKFLNEMPNYSRDKTGYNVAILIIQILFYLKQKKRTKIVDRMEILANYMSRYLRKHDNYRSNIFIRMLLAMTRKSFKKEETEKLAQQYYFKLLSNPAHEETHEIEIVPFDILWEKTISLL